jgi:hypothetical protein
MLHLCDHLGITGRERPEGITPIAADRMGNAIIHLLDGVPVDDGCHRQMRSSIDNLMDRVQFWREHPGEAYEGQGVADALMPIITQLVEYAQAGGAE